MPKSWGTAIARRLIYFFNVVDDMDNGRSQVAQTAFLYALVGWDFGGVALLEHPGKYFDLFFLP
jgi:hypothetical protein